MENFYNVLEHNLMKLQHFIKKYLCGATSKKRNRYEYLNPLMHVSLEDLEKNPTKYLTHESEYIRDLAKLILDAK